MSSRGRARAPRPVMLFSPPPILVDHHHIDETLTGSRRRIFMESISSAAPVKRLPKPIQKWRAHRDRRAFVGSSEARWSQRRRFLSGHRGDRKAQRIVRVVTVEGQKAGRDPKVELSCIGQAKVDSLEALREIGIARVVIPLPAYDPEGITRGLEKIANEVIDRL